MSNYYLRPAALTLIVLVLGCTNQSDTDLGATVAPKVILIIGDGMDDTQITMARNYLKGAQGRLTLDSMPVRSSVQVLTVSDDDPSSSSRGRIGMPRNS